MNWAVRRTACIVTGAIFDYFSMRPDDDRHALWLSSLAWGLPAATRRQQPCFSERDECSAAGFADIRPGSEEEFMHQCGTEGSTSTEGSATVSDEAKMTVVNQANWLKQNKSWLVKDTGPCR
jgi:hypothetical protein